MNALARLSAPLLAAASRFWLQRDSRERLLMTVAAVVLGPAVLVFAVLLPLYDRIDALDARLPGLRARVAQMQDLQRSAAGGAVVREMPGDLGDRVRRALEHRGVAIASLTQNPTGVDLVIDEAPFDGLLKGLAELQALEAVFAGDLSLTPARDAGWITGRMRLFHAGSEAR